MMFSGTKLSDFMKLNPDIAKTACNEAVFKNGALCFAIIGLIIRKNISSWNISWSYRYKINYIVLP